MVLFAYDLETYRDDVRGFYVDPLTEVPGPVVRSTDELADALDDIESVHAAHADRYRAFAERFCALEDGNASSRAVDLLLAVQDS
jgi:CDP-glycerol glycerophosphotransferase